ncbi:hypothetical protein BD410DRAFT_643922 [Rickenella mellea]|uniref:Uncharacterized protein n=1 Tax=Rickenella mellea TaxID=50990 RepID=A0A4Y7PML1_9AGAM|nr:hypothetical protein BD410DRAFT_643922 [Rickenella mellea]
MPTNMDLATLEGKGYTFNVGGKLMSNTAAKLTKTLVDQARNRDPDTHGLYIYNDFSAYAILDLVDCMLSKIHSKVAKKSWMEAWVLLEALTLFMHRESDWPMCDDGKRVIITDLAFGALLVTTMRALQASSTFNEDNIVNLEYTLREAASWGEAMSGVTRSKYVKVVKGLGRKIFGGLTDEERNERSKWREVVFEQWLKGQSEEVREERRRQLEDEDEEDDEDDEDEEEEETKWYGRECDGDPDLKDRDFELTKTWKNYKDCLLVSARTPLRVPPIWDLTKWTKEERHKFSLDRCGEDDDEEM